MPKLWNPPVNLSAKEKAIAKRCKKRRVFVFLRELRHEIFDDEMQEKLWSAYSRSERGKKRVPPAQLALASLLQAALEVPDHEVVELTVMDLRWQMVLGCLGAAEPPFSQGTLYHFRERMIAHGLDEVLFERTIRIARKSGGFGATRLRAAFDASPLWGAGRVEDTFNLIGRAAMHVVRSAAERLGKSLVEVAQEAGIPVAAASSIKAGLDIDWDNPQARTVALGKLLDQVQALGRWLETELHEQMTEPPLQEQWALVQKLIDQDTEPDPDGAGRRITRGVARDRQISISDPGMRHGRKSKRKLIDGYKRHLAIDVDTPGIVCAVAIAPANQPERDAAEPLIDEIEGRGFSLSDTYIDRGYLGAEAVEERRESGMAVHCKPFPLHNRGRFTKGDFKLDLEKQQVTCPNDVTRPAVVGKVTRFPAQQCDPCEKRDLCTRARQGRGRSLSIHPKEPFLVELREQTKTEEGRAGLRLRIKVEHSLARLWMHQGNRARYRGERKNLFDLRRHAAVINLGIADQLRQAA